MKGISFQIAALAGTVIVREKPGPRKSPRGMRAKTGGWNCWARQRETKGCFLINDK